MTFVYILLLSNNTYYTGITNKLAKRILQHQKGQCKSTRYHLPVILKHTEKFFTRKQARQKEVYIKNIGAKRYLNKLKFSPHVV